MKKIFLGLAVLAVIGAGLFFITASRNKKPADTAPVAAASLTAPARTAEINGYILSVQGNEITVANEIGVKEITDEERARRQKMTPEERQALRAQESANLKKENITLTIPVGVTIAKGTGNATGENIKAEMSELAKGLYVSIWKTGDTIEFVKLKGVSSQ